MTIGLKEQKTKPPQKSNENERIRQYVERFYKLTQKDKTPEKSRKKKRISKYRKKTVNLRD